jgi:hypothetical protein
VFGFFLNIVEKIDSDFREHIVKTGIAVSVLATAYLLSENIFLSFIIASAAAVLLLGWDSRFFIGAALVFLIACPFWLAFEKKSIAEELAVYAYYMLALGVFLQIIQYFKDSFFSENRSKKRKKRHSKRGPAEILSKKRILIFSLGAAFLVLAVFAGCFSLLYLKMEEKFNQNEKLMADTFAAISEEKKQAAEKEAKNPPEPAGDDLKAGNASWESVRVLIENTTGQEGLEERVAERVRESGGRNVYTGKAVDSQNQETSIQYCASCLNVATEILGGLQNPEKIVFEKNSILTEEIRIALGADQILVANGDISVSILNASDIAGMARKLKSKMAEDGFDMKNVVAADKDDYPKTIIKYSLDNLGKADIIQEYLSASYNSLEMIEDPALAVDVEIVLGNQ